MTFFQLTWADMFTFVVIETAVNPTSPLFKNPLVPLKSNKKVIKLAESYPTAMAYYKRVRGHPMLEKYFKERPSDDKVDF